jgi:hypothetical protein
MQQAQSFIEWRHKIKVLVAEKPFVVTAIPTYRSIHNERWNLEAEIFALCPNKNHLDQEKMA